MEARHLVPLPSPAPRTEVRVDGERILVERLVLADPALARFVAERPPEEHATLAERAFRIGLTALQDAGVSIDVDLVRREFDALVRRTEQENERAATSLDAILRQNFADGDGRLPRTLERFLGDRGALRSFVDDLFDERKRDSAIGRMKVLLGTYFDGDASRLAQLLDPTRLGSPLHQFRIEMTEGFAGLHQRLAAIEAANAARIAERARSAAKGGDFEDILEALLADAVRGQGDHLDRTSGEAGDVIRSKKGDFVVTIDPAAAHGADLRVVVEAKDRAMSGRAMRDELREAKTNRGAAVGMVVFTPGHAPSGIAPFDLRAGDVYCVVDPADPDPAILEAALRLARLLAIVSIRDAEVEVDVGAIRAALDGIREQLDAIRAMKSQLTSITTASGDVTKALERLRAGIVARLDEAAAELRVAAPPGAGPGPGP